MRLGVLEHGHRLRTRLFLALVARLSGVEMADVPKTLLYRPEFFGRAMLDLSADMMRGPSFWTAGEREYMALSTARLHSCSFCIETHAELTRIASDGEIDPADPGSARPQLTAVLELLEQLARAPDSFLAADLDRVRDAGVGDEAIVDALHVKLVWDTINRLANVFDYQLRDGQLLKGARALHRLGYRFPGVLTRGGQRVDHGAGITDRHGRLVARLRQAVLSSPAETAPATRSAAATGAPLPEPWHSYAAKVREESSRVTNADIDRLAAAGHSEDEIFEVTVAAAVGAALRDRDAGMRALRGEPQPT